MDNSGDAVRLIDAVGIEVLRLLLPALAVLCVAGILASMLQNLPSIVMHRIAPKWLKHIAGERLEAHLRRQGPGRVSKVAVEVRGRVRLVFLLLRTAHNDMLNAMFMIPSLCRS